MQLSDLVAQRRQMLAHRSGCALRIARFDRVQHCAMLSVGSFRIERLPEVQIPGARRALVQRLGELAKDA